MFTYEAPYHNKAAGNRSQDNTKNKDYYCNITADFKNLAKIAEQNEYYILQYLRKIIEERKLTYEMLVEATGICKDTLYYVMSRKKIKLRLFLALMYTLKLTPWELRADEKLNKQQISAEMNWINSMINCELIELSPKDYSADEICQEKVERCMNHMRKRIKAVRVAKGWSQKTLAYKTGMSTRTIREFEKGSTKNPTLITFEQLRLALGLSLDELFLMSTEQLAQRGKYLWDSI